MRQELLKYTLYVIKRIWIVLLLTAVVTGGVYWYLGRQRPTYRAETRVFVGNVTTSPNPDRVDQLIAQDLVPTYIELVRTSDVLQATLEDLDLTETMSVGRLRGMISAREILNTSIFVIRVTDSNRERAAEIANTLAENLIERSPTNPTADEQLQLQILRQQIEDLQSQIDTRSDQAIEIGNALDVARAQELEREVFDLTQQYNQVVEQLDTARGVLAQLSSSYQGLSNRVNRLTIVEAAQPPSGSTNINRNLVTLLAAVGTMGVGIAGLLLYLEYVDGKIRIENEIKRMLHVPLLGSIPHVRGISSPPNALVTQKPGSRAYEGFRAVLTKLLFSSAGQAAQAQHEAHVYLISSPDKVEGRSFIAANLAVIVAEAGLKTLLIDADLRKPMLNAVFDLDNTCGLVPLLAQINTNPQYEEQSPNDTQVIVLTRQHIQNTQVKNLKVMTTGLSGVSLSSEMLGFQNLQRALDAIQREFDFDIILFDTPPALLTSDTYVLSASIGAEIILVVNSGRSNRADLIKVRDQYQHIGSNISGAILNHR